MVADASAQAAPTAPMATTEISGIFCRAGERTLNARSQAGRAQCQLALRESRGCFTGVRRQVAELINQGKLDWGDSWLESAHLWDLDSITYLFVDGANHHKIPSSMERCSSEIFR